MGIAHPTKPHQKYKSFFYQKIATNVQSEQLETGKYEKIEWGTPYQTIIKITISGYEELISRTHPPKMTYAIHTECIACDACRPRCPTGAISANNKKYNIDPNLCNDCQGYFSHPLCVLVCPTLHPVPWNCSLETHRQPRQPYSTSSHPHLFIQSNSGFSYTPFASAIVIWEACNIFTQKQSLPWHTDSEGKMVYRRNIKKGKGSLTFRMKTGFCPNAGLLSVSENNASQDFPSIAAIDPRAACLHLLYAGYATTLERPWEENFTISDRQIEAYLGLNRRKDLSKITKLALIKYLALEPTRLQCHIQWFRQGNVPAFAVEEEPIWRVVEVHHHFHEDENGEKHVTGLTFEIQAGTWAKYFLNWQGYQEKTAFYQYGILPEWVLKAVMRLWQRREGAVRILLWLLFKVKIGREQPIAVATLMRIAYGENKIQQAYNNRHRRKRQIQTFESDLQALSEYGIQPIFDPQTYPTDIQPIWLQLQEIPEDSEAALAFWTADGQRQRRLTDPAPRGKWERLMRAKLLRFQLPEAWEEPLARFKSRQKPSSRSDSRSNYRRYRQPKRDFYFSGNVSGEAVKQARCRRGWSQRYLARMMGKSQSWVRDVERGRLQVKSRDWQRLCEILSLGDGG